MVSEPPNNSLENRQKFAEILFEEYEVQALYFASQPVLSLFASAKTTGTVVDSGHGVTHAVPIYEGYAIPHAVLTMPLAGKDLSEYMNQMIKKSGLIDKIEDDSFTFDVDMARDVKEKYCVVA
mmetsp:Transcript_26173/g.19661  ORF Transcript_26173/g.19661 Transcript_26173/m.19661 type:complete len:123 (+) Transcript_26173:320-688(+)